jgi:peptidoglycan/xylan/chitin deacetylase (PgdA/CDA1 family)
LKQAADSIRRHAAAGAGEAAANGRVPPPPRNADAAAPAGAAIVLRRTNGREPETTDRVPILMYHAVAAEGPSRLARYRVTPADFEAQMRWLRDRGYHAITSTDLLSHFKTRRPFEGRPVMLTFDDGLRSYGECAWPILSGCGFNAENFIVTDLVGTSAEWDGEDGRRQALMDWAEIERLSRSGARFGSHLATHRYADSLTSRELLEEAARSRGVLEGRLRSGIISLAAPFGCLDERFARTAQASGYKVLYSTRHGFARIGESVMNLPRIEVRGDWDLAQFAKSLEAVE